MGRRLMMEKSRVAVNDAPAIGPTGELVWARMASG